ncbi:hypothetical protein CORC01_02762 [Colletotrichum orchidophilum]|uniref:Uncharacterized protein n=1 Tax=Colletotrichum orchidophilum TaxID=1209926 RepID=A0A1G4BKD8_9PEZI|nr:uncharacterized protein CORC01_02762 [Colletotrichum orchidophilum]OHF01884.1 hypothetical protein CORC01_02762 [Colletotrichum orchidophilum]
MSRPNSPILVIDTSHGGNEDGWTLVADEHKIVEVFCAALNGNNKVVHDAAKEVGREMECNPSGARVDNLTRFAVWHSGRIRETVCRRGLDGLGQRLGWPLAVPQKLQETGGQKQRPLLFWAPDKTHMPRRRCIIGGHEADAGGKSRAAADGGVLCKAMLDAYSVSRANGCSVRILQVTDVSDVVRRASTHEGGGSCRRTGDKANINSIGSLCACASVASVYRGPQERGFPTQPGQELAQRWYPRQHQPKLMVLN